MQNFTFQDLTGSIIAFLLFPIIYVIPGYVIGWTFDLFDFRKRLPATRFVIAIIVSISISPILTFLSWNLISVKATYVILVFFTAVFIYTFFKTKKTNNLEGITHLYIISICAAAGWSILSILFLIDIQWGDRLYYNVVSYDFTTRVAIINAMTRSGVPPINPSYFPGHPILLTYLYYFLYIPPSLVDQIGGSWVNGRNAMVASVAWCGLGLMATIALYLRLRNSLKGSMAWKAGLLGSGLLLVSGLDFIPALFLIIRTRLSTGSSLLQGDIEHWNEQITAWIGALSWVPHHVAAMIACLTGIMFVHSARGKGTLRQLTLMSLAGLAFASAVGLSIYITAVFVVFWGIWMLMLFLQKERRLSLAMSLSGLVALIAAGPFLIGLISGGSSTSNPGLPLTFEVRRFGPILPYIQDYPTFIINLVNLLFLPINYLFELGFFFVAGLLWIQQNWRIKWYATPYQTSEIILIVVTFIIGSLFRSTVIGSNDLGWRVWLFGQFILLIWSVDVILRIFPDLKLKISDATTFINKKNWRSLRILLILGLITSIVDFTLLRVWPLLVDLDAAGFPNSFSTDTNLGQRTFSVRETYDFINVTLPVNIHIQPNPAELINRPIGLYSNRPIAISGLTAYGVPVKELLARVDVVAKIFETDMDWSVIDQTCKDNFIDIIVVSDEDPLWHRLTFLNSERTPLYQNPHHAVFSCGNLKIP